MSVGLMPVGNDAPFLDSSGNPLSGGLMYFYTAGSSTPENTYTTSAGSVANANPVVLDSGGYPASGGSVVQIWGTNGVRYKAILKTSAGVTVWTRDNLEIINDTSVTIDQWVAGPAPTYIGATSFSLVGDQTSTFQVGRRVKTTNSGGTIYSTISASAFGAVTTVTVVNDSGSPDAGLSAVSYGLLAKTNDSLPRGVFPTMANVSKAIYGLTYANGTDATNDLDIAAGGCIDSTGVDTITVAAITKQSDVAWAVGSGNGGLDTGAVGNSDYYIWAIKRVDTQVTDVLYSLSSTAPTMPANYTLKRLIGWFKRVAGTIVAFKTYETEGGGLRLQWTVPTLDVSLANTLATTPRSDAVKVPLNFSTTAHLNVAIGDDAILHTVRVYCPDQTDTALSDTAAPLANIKMAVLTVPAISQLDVKTSATGTIRSIAKDATVNTYYVVTEGFDWARRN